MGTQYSHSIPFTGSASFQVSRVGYLCLLQRLFMLLLHKANGTVGSMSFISTDQYDDIMFSPVSLEPWWTRDSGSLHQWLHVWALALVDSKDIINMEGTTV
jgi:hypothetical protein